MINNSNFVLDEIPILHPEYDIYDYIDFWSSNKRRCIEGYWVGGKWCPGPLYYYVNFHKILVDSNFGTSQMPSFPFFRDNEWELFYIFEEARGFSGFSEDLTVTSNRWYGPDKEKALHLGWITKEESESKTYIPAREYLRTLHPTSLGKPLYQNSAKNILSLQGRGTGKSYSASGIVAHNFLFDGVTDYDQYLSVKQHAISIGDPELLPSSTSIVGASDTKYSNPLVAKVKYGFNHLPGGYKKNGEDIPAPFWRETYGSLQPNKEYYVTQSSSQIWHRTFLDNPLAANGSRPNVAVLDEVGFLSTIKSVLPGLEATMGQKAKFKNLVIFGLGTGGLFNGQAALYTQDIANNPADYDCLAFDNKYESVENKICHFVPGHFALNDYKEGPDMITNFNEADKYIDHELETAKKSRRQEKYLATLINHPKKLSDIFLSEEGNIFPTPELKDRLSQILSSKKLQDASWKGELADDGHSVFFKASATAYPIHEFPLPRNARKEGAIEIFEKPSDSIIPFRYIIGADTVDKNKSTTDSLFSVLVFDRLTRRIVAEWTGRRKTPAEQYEVCRKLSLYYNKALILYEQHLTGIFDHFSHKYQLHLLADTPHWLRNSETFVQDTNTGKGVSTPIHVVNTGNDLIIDLLLEGHKEMQQRLDNIAEKGKGITEEERYEKLTIPLYQLRSIGLLKELIYYNAKGNFDRVAALRLIAILDKSLNEVKKDSAKKVKDITDDPYWQTHLGRDTSGPNQFDTYDVLNFLKQ
jgi:hypothetical protein